MKMTNPTKSRTLHADGRNGTMHGQSSSRWLLSELPRFVRTPAAATLLGLSPRTLEKHRVEGTGPIYRKLGGRVVYAIEDLDAWAALGARRSTSDPGVGITPLPGSRTLQD
jgi:predicted DNA-binding transcriptional regulator AlpA